MTATLDARIGMLNGGRFYCFPNGYGAPEFVGTLEEVEASLGLRAPPSRPLAPASQAKTRRSSESISLRDYEVTVTPAVVLHAGTWAGTAYVVKVSARNRDEAIRLARAERRDNEGRMAPPATYRARISRDD